MNEIQILKETILNMAIEIYGKNKKEDNLPLGRDELKAIAKHFKGE